MTLALLLTAVTGAWAQTETLLTTITPTGTDSYSETTPGVVTVTLSNVASYSSTYGWLWGAKSGPGSVTVEAKEGYTITRCVFKQNDKPSVTITTSPFTITFANGKCEQSNHDMDGVTSIEVYGNAPAAEAPITVEPVTGKTNEWTFTMPAFDVEIAPIYAPTAVFATDGNLVLTPTAIEGIYAESTDAIVKAGTVAKIGETENPQGTLMYAVGTSATEQPALTAFSATLPTAEKIAAGDVYVWYYIKGADTPTGEKATAENTFNDSEICATPLTVTVLNNKFDIQFNAANANTIEAGKATVTVGGTAATVTEGKLEGVKMGSEVKVKANTGYKFRKVEVKKGGGEPVLFTTITAADNSSFKSGSQTFGDVATVTLTGDYLINDGSHGGWYCQGSNKTATISVAEANGANITSVKFYTAGGGSAEDKDAPFEVTTTTVTSSNITTYLNGNSIGSYGVSKIEVYGTK